MSASTEARPRPKLPLWAIIATGGAIIGISLGIRHTFGLFLAPISQDLGVGRGAFALAMGLQNILWGVSAPFFGAIADKYGSGRVVVAGAVLYFAGLWLTASAGSETDLVLGGVVIGLGVSASGFTAVLGAVGRAAPPERRQTALALASMAGSIGQFVALPYAQVLIEGFGWVTAMAVIAVTAGIMVPLAWGIAGKPEASTDGDTQSLTEALREAIRNPSFLLLTAGFFVCGFHVVFVGTHLPAFLADQGFEPWLGAVCLAIIGFVNIIGTYVFGRAGQFKEKRLVLSWLYFARAFVFLGILVVPLTVPTVLIFATAIGFLWLGTVPLTSGLVATLFGPRWMSMLFGIVFFSHQIGSFLGAWLGGYVYDAVQSYDVMWWLSVGLALLAALLHWPIKERPVPRLAAQEAS
ncbi:MAG: MFS transporter [Methyloligellaceae bacterium]